MRKLFVFIFCLSAFSGFSQTKMIAFKSHSGSSENFSIALEHNLFDMENGNFGEPPDRNLDSVILIKDSIAITIMRPPGKPGQIDRDTIINHPLLKKGTPADTLKKYIHRVTWFSSSADSIKFIGFDTEANNKRKKNSLPLAGYNNTGNNPFSGEVVVITGAILILSLLAGLAAWKIKPASAIQPA